MNKNIISFLIVLAVSLTLAVGVGLAGSDGGAVWNGWPVMAICAVWAFLVNWVVFVPANMHQTEKYYDLTGSLTYLSMIGLAVALTPAVDLRGKIVAALVVIWALRLGTFLFKRISQDGKDDRFDQIKTQPFRFLTAWTLQGLWVFLTAACALAVITGQNAKPIGVIGLIGLAVWLFGFIVEVVADKQKSRFKQDPANQGRFIDSGLWSWSRHPNYFGEMTLWTGMAIVAVPVLSGWQWIPLISPIFVFVLINYVSGVNKLEEKADKKWGDEAAYQAYKEKTSKLVLWPPRD